MTAFQVLYLLSPFSSNYITGPSLFMKPEFVIPHIFTCRREMFLQTKWKVSNFKIDSSSTDRPLNTKFREKTFSIDFQISIDFGTFPCTVILIILPTLSSFKWKRLKKRTFTSLSLPVPTNFNFYPLRDKGLNGVPSHWGLLDVFLTSQYNGLERERFQTPKTLIGTGQMIVTMVDVVGRI